MMDILLESQKSASQISTFLAEVFECQVNKIKSYSLDEFNCLTKDLDAYALDCVCVFSSVQGDASQLLQLYRYNISDPDVVERVVDIALKNKIHVYIPTDPFNGWVYVGDDGPKNVHQIDSDEDNCFYFG